MTTDTAEVLAANEELYAAFESGDLDRMKSLWVGADDGVMARCAHPGGEFVLGTDAVLRSWALVMANAENLQFILTDVETLVRGEMATANCTEIILRPGAGPDPFVSSHAVTTNGFIRLEGVWRMWLHHASPVMGATEGEDL